MLELISHTNGNDEVVGTTTKQESHCIGLPHRVTAIFITKGDKLLVNERLDDGLFDHSVGGHVRCNESYREAAIREAREEVGLMIHSKTLETVGHFFVDESQRMSNVKHWFTLYHIEVSTDFIPQPQLAEVKSLCFINLNEIALRMRLEPEKFCFGFLATMNVYLQKKEGISNPIPLR